MIKLMKILSTRAARMLHALSVPAMRKATAEFSGALEPHREMMLRIKDFSRGLFGVETVSA
ncbi:MAG TPA: hypothetical protein VHC39_18315 [Rhizomicrobium sp.]|nr:hypothetical protein [Rhizomicrobium sp.]